MDSAYADGSGNDGGGLLGLVEAASCSLEFHSRHCQS